MFFFSLQNTLFISFYLFIFTFCPCIFLFLLFFCKYIHNVYIFVIDRGFGCFRLWFIFRTIYFKFFFFRCFYSFSLQNLTIIIFVIRYDFFFCFVLFSVRSFVCLLICLLALYLSLYGVYSGWFLSFFYFSLISP